MLIIDPYKYAVGGGGGGITIASLPAVTVLNGANITLTFSNFVDSAGNPFALAENDVVVAAYTHNSGTVVNISTSSSGWTEEAEVGSVSTRQTDLAVYTKRMSSSPDANIVFNGPGGNSTGSAAVAFAFRGIDTATLLDVAVVTANGTGSIKPNPGSITPSTAGSIIVVVGAGAATTGALYTTPADLSSTTNYFRSGYCDESVDATIGIGVKDDWVSGAFDPGVWPSTASDAAEQSWAAVTLALRPA